MKENNYGFATSGIMYTILLLFIVLTAGVLTLLLSRKIVLDDIKEEVRSSLDIIKFQESYYGEEDYIKNGLIAWYDSIKNIQKINDGLISETILEDFSNSNNRGQLSNFDDAWQNKYLKFDGIDDTVLTNLTNQTFDPNLSYTIETYIKLNKVTADNNHTNGHSDTGTIAGAFSYEGYGISWITKNQNPNEYYIVAGDRLENSTNLISIRLNEFDKKIHLIYVHSKEENKNKLYIDGILVGEIENAPGSYQYVSNMGSFGINKNQLYGGYFNPRYTDMNMYTTKIYNRSLSSEEVAMNYKIDTIRYKD